MTADTTPRLLIVDDLPENLFALEALVRDDGVTVHRATSGEEALSLLLEHEFALAIIDVQMPGMTGFELGELIRGSSRTRDLPIVFVSAAGRELNYAFKGYENGAVDFLHKPLDGFAVRSKVRVFTELYLKRVELRKQLAELQQARERQERLLQELQATQTELQRALTQRDEFMSMVAHELRTPLNVMSLSTRMRQQRLERGDMAAFDALHLNDMFAKDARQIRSMTRLIEDMLDISRIQHGKLSVRLAPTDLSELVQRVVGDFWDQGHEALVRAQVQPEVHGQWDGFRIEQVLINLLSNAIRYGEAKPVEVNLVLQGGEARLSVRDHGPGIAAKDRQRIFEQFVRLDDRAAAPGMGLGLYITRHFVQAHGGTICVESEPGQGTTFTVRLPVPAAAATSTTTTQSDAALAVPAIQKE